MAMKFGFRNRRARIQPYLLQTHVSNHQNANSLLQVEAKSYKEIELSLGVDEPRLVTFATDVYGEAVAASEAGWEAVLVVRPGNKPLPADASGHFRVIESLEELLE